MIDPLEGSLFDLPDYEHIQDEELQPLPPPDSPGGNDDEAVLVNGELESNKLSQTKDASGTTKRGVKRPLPKLDAQRLVSERGLPALRNMFDNVKFKGKGHEEADLQTLIRQMEHWAHRLFPKLQFEEFVDRVERLGSKKAVQGCLKRIRLDLPILHDDFSTNEGEDGGDHGPSIATEGPDIFSEIQTTKDKISSPLTTTLTEEQRQRMERNRQRALEKRQAKIQSSSLLQEHADLGMSQPGEERKTVVNHQQDDVNAVEAGNMPSEAMENVGSGSVDEDK